MDVPGGSGVPGDPRGTPGKGRGCGGLTGPGGHTPSGGPRGALERLRHRRAEPRGPGEAMARSFAAVPRAVFVHNPFYVISAALILYGLDVVLGASDAWADRWMLLWVLSGYTALMVLAGVLIVRLGSVWEDARSVFLVVIILFGAVSVSFDEILVAMPEAGRGFVLVGLGCAMALSEALLRGTGIRLGALFRAPYYAILSLFYLYPLLLSGLLDRADATNRSGVTWGLAAFGVAAGAAFLTLIPAIRRGREYVRDSATPWAWPWFPWAGFAVLAGGVLVRSYWLTLSFYPAYKMYSPFGSYILSPFVLAGCVLALEFAISHRSRRAAAVALVLPAVAVFMSFPPTAVDRSCAEFLAILMAGAGSPAWVVLLAALSYYAYALARGERRAEWGVAAVLFVLAVAGEKTTGLWTLTAPRALPLAALAAFAGVTGALRRSSWRWALSVVASAAALSILFGDTRFVAARGAVPVHLALFGLLAVGALCRDRFARFLQDAGAPAMAVLFASALFLGGRIAPDAPGAFVAAYCAAMMAATAVYWWMVRNRRYVWALALQATAGTVYGCVSGAALLGSPTGPRGLAPILLGALSFAVAVGVSSVKGGIVPKLGRCISRLAASAGKGV